MSTSRPILRHWLIQRRLFITVAVIFFLGMTVPAQAFRPFLSEEADVLTPENFEIEFGIFDVSHQAGDLIFGHPLQLEAGLIKNWELILRGELQTVFKNSQISLNTARENMASVDLLVKGVLREGSLHSNSDWIPSLAVMLGPLFPTAREDEKVGFQGTVIASGRTAPIIYHLNIGGLLDKIHNDPGFIWGVVLEYQLPKNLTAVWEIAGRSVSGNRPDDSTLVGMIWSIPSHQLSFDIGGRFGLTDAAPDWLFTLGVTFSFSAP